MNKITNCKYCDGKGFFTVCNGRYTKCNKDYPAKIRAVACPKCNKGNKLNLKDIKKNIYEY
ncbi:MAG: hypothetical protein PHQ01_03225 [Candidatus Pacebacteria bacterium]|nr:hypothetical protein [Candidatus Paceibacterota bacterium]